MKIKCPACEIEIDEYDTGWQVWHMERCHPEILEDRWNSNNLSAREIDVLKADINKRLPSFEVLCSECQNMKGWDVVYKLDKGGHWIILTKDKQAIATNGVSAVAALSLAMDIAIFRKWY